MQRKMRSTLNSVQPMKSMTIQESIVKGDYFYISRRDENVEKKGRSLFVVSPSYAFLPIEDLKVSVGLIAAFENDTIDSKNVHVYPDIRASYPISPSVDAVASLSGGMEKVSLQSSKL